MLEGFVVGHGDVFLGDAGDGSIEFVEDAVLDLVGELRADSAEGAVLFDDEGAIGFGDRAADRVHVEGADGAEVDHFGLDIEFGFDFLRGFQDEGDGLGIGDNGEVGALAEHVRLAEGNRQVDVEILDLAGGVVEALALEDDDRIVVADGGFEEALGIADGAGRADFETGDVGVKGLGGVGMGRRRRNPDIVRQASRLCFEVKTGGTPVSLSFRRAGFGHHVVKLTPMRGTGLTWRIFRGFLLPSPPSPFGS